MQTIFFPIAIPPGKNNGPSLIKIKSDDPKQAQALISGGGGLVCQKAGIIFRDEEFKTTPSILQCFQCQGFRHKLPNCTKNEKCVVCGEAHSHRNCPNKEKKKPKCAKKLGGQIKLTNFVSESILPKIVEGIFNI